MKITAIKYFMPKIGHRCRFIVKVETDAGLYGLGEAGTSGRERALAGMIDHFREFLIGRDPRRIEDIAQELYRSQYFEGGTVIAAAASAIDIALWDILGKHLNTPVYQLLGGATRNYVECFADVRMGNGSTWGEKASDLVEKGWQTLRMTPLPSLPEGDTIYEPWNSLHETAELVHEVRRAVGGRIQLGVDFHHRLSIAEAAEFSRRIEDAGLMFLEEPIRSESPDAYAALRAMTPVPFAIGEEFSGIFVFAPFIERGLANYVRPDVCNVGGLTGTKKVAAMAEAHYIDVMPHDPLGPICTAASVHLCAAIPNFASLEYNSHVQDQPEDLFPVTLSLEKNYFPLPRAPGLGVEFNEEAAKDYPFAFWEAPHLRRSDGSFTNW